MNAFTTTLACLLGLVGLVQSQGFLGNCTWQSANLTGSLLGMYCNDDDWANYGYQWTCMFAAALSPEPTSLHICPYPSFTDHRYLLASRAGTQPLLWQQRWQPDSLRQVSHPSTPRSPVVSLVCSQRDQNHVLAGSRLTDLPTTQRQLHH